jgi:hypothetical protein
MMSFHCFSKHKLLVTSISYSMLNYSYIWFSFSKSSCFVFLKLSLWVDVPDDIVARCYRFEGCSGHHIRRDNVCITWDCGHALPASKSCWSTGLNLISEMLSVGRIFRPLSSTSASLIVGMHYLTSGSCWSTGWNLISEVLSVGRIFRPSSSIQCVARLVKVTGAQAETWGFWVCSVKRYVFWLKSSMLLKLKIRCFRGPSSSAFQDGYPKLKAYVIF